MSMSKIGSVRDSQAFNAFVARMLPTEYRNGCIRALPSGDVIANGRGKAAFADCLSSVVFTDE